MNKSILTNLNNDLRLAAKFAVWLLVLNINFEISTVRAQGTAFNYQGQLNEGDSPVNGSYDMTFTLFTTNTDGVALAGPMTNSAIAVSNGLFGTTINFGPGVFAGGTNWLELAVRPNGSSTFVTLSPRQQVTPTPYAILAGTVAAGGITAGSYTNAVLFSNSANAFTGTFTGNGSGLTGVDAAAVQPGITLTNVTAYGTISQVCDIVSIACVLTNAWAGGPFWSSNSFAPVPWQYFQPPVGTNWNQYGGNDFLFVKRNAIYVPASNLGAVALNYVPMDPPGDLNGYPAAGVSFCFNVSGDRFAVGLPGQGSSMRLVVDGIQGTITTYIPPNGNNYTYVVVFASSKSRNIELMLAGSGNNALEGIFIPPTNAFAPFVSKPLKTMIVVGDSYDEEPIPNYSTPEGYNSVGLGFATQLGLLMPALDVWPYGLGGTGYVNPGSGRTAATNRIVYDVIPHKPDYVLFALGINDTSYPSNSVFTAVTNCIGQVLAGSSNTVIYAVGPWWSHTPTAGDPVFMVRQAISNGLAYYGLGANYIDTLGPPTATGYSPATLANAAGGPWIYGYYNVPGSGNAVNFISSDGTHPTPAGHAYLAQRLALELSRRGVPQQ
jgi:lysophospholipase L1-like esterase